MISFTDLFGGQRAKLVPAQAIADMQEEGAGFAGFATWLDMTPAIRTCWPCPTRPRSSSCPGSRRSHGSPANCVMEGEGRPGPAQCPAPAGREAADAGLHVKTGVEAEFFLLTPEGTEISDPNTTRPKSPATTSRR
jgi:glutamine synthetase